MTLSWLSSAKSSNYEGSGHRCLLCFVYLCTCWFCQVYLFGALRVFYSAHPHTQQQTQDTGGLPPHQPGRWQKGDATAWLPVRLCLPGHIAFQKVTPAFILWSQSWQSTNLPRLLHTSHALLSCLVDAGGQAYFRPSTTGDVRLGTAGAATALVMVEML